MSGLSILYVTICQSSIYVIARYIEKPLYPINIIIASSSPCNGLVIGLNTQDGRISQVKICIWCKWVLKLGKWNKSVYGIVLNQVWLIKPKHLLPLTTNPPWISFETLCGDICHASPSHGPTRSSTDACNNDTEHWWVFMMRRHSSSHVTISSMMPFKLEGVEWSFMSWRRHDLFGRTRFVSPCTYQVKMTQ